MKSAIPIAASLLLAACGGSAGEADNAAANAAINATNVVDAPAPPADKDPAAATAGNTASASGASAAEPGARATASSPSSEIRALLIGRWADNGNCATATEFRADGTFASPLGAGRWTLESEYLTLTGVGPNAEVAVQEIDGRDMATVSPTGHIGHWTRC